MYKMNFKKIYFASIAFFTTPVAMAVLPILFIFLFIDSN